MATESETRIRNAVITDTMLGIEDHGIFSASITLDYGGTFQHFGGYCLGMPPDTEVDVPSDAASRFIQRTLQVAGVDKWEDLVGRPIRAEASRKGVEAIGHFMNNDWFYPKQELVK